LEGGNLSVNRSWFSHSAARQWNKACLKKGGPHQLPLQTQSKAIFTTSLFAIAWIVTLSFGLRTLLSYESAPGQVGTVPSTWPTESKIHLETSGETLVMLAHPHCPCTRASVGELAQIMARVQGKVRAYVLFLKPNNSGTGWEDTDLRRSAAAIPGVTVLSDVDGAEAARFGAETSGHTLLFNSTGHLLFSGGITESRGHAGGNAGESAIVSLVNNHAADRAKTFVFGCSLVEHKPKGGEPVCLK
jgi:hypothetical protein